MCFPTQIFCGLTRREKHILHFAYPLNEFSFKGPHCAPFSMTCSWIVRLRYLGMMGRVSALGCVVSW